MRRESGALSDSKAERTISCLTSGPCLDRLGDWIICTGNLMSDSQSAIYSCPACLKQYAWLAERAGRKAMCSCGLIIRFPTEAGGKLQIVGRKPPQVKPDKHEVVNNTALAMEIAELNDRSKNRKMFPPLEEERSPEHRPIPPEDRPEAPLSATGRTPPPDASGFVAKGCCPACGVVMAKKATVCLACGYDIVARKQVGPMADPNDPQQRSAVFNLSGILGPRRGPTE